MVNKKQLIDSVRFLDGWNLVESSPLEGKIVNALALDEYVNLTYSNGIVSLNLYVGYYYTAEKVGAAHDPNVCFFGQGWIIEDTVTDSYHFVQKGKTFDISHAQFKAKKGSSTQLVLYWFQSYEHTSAGTFSQKIYTFWNRLTRGVESNAFVRISMEADSEQNKEEQEILFNFIRQFYPNFVKYVTG